jgi:hypothetical protein
MPVKCGKGHYHDSIAEVRECYNVGAAGFPRSYADYKENRFPGKCVKCGGRVEANRGRVDKTDDGWVTSHRPGDCRAIPAKIDVKATVAANTDLYSEIPVGHYATKSLSGNNDLDFWRVDRPEQGTYAGRTFVKRIVGGKPDLNVSRETKFAALDAILAEGIEDTARRYGQELGRCSRCNRTLTDQVSREFGKGPECRSK